MVVPVRHIKAPVDMQKWTNSKAYDDYILFVLAMNRASKGHNAKCVVFRLLVIEVCNDKCVTTHGSVSIYRSGLT